MSETATPAETPEVNPLQAEVGRLQNVLAQYQQLHADEVLKSAILKAEIAELRAAQGAS